MLKVYKLLRNQSGKKPLKYQNKPQNQTFSLLNKNKSMLITIFLFSRVTPPLYGFKGFQKVFVKCLPMTRRWVLGNNQCNVCCCSQCYWNCYKSHFEISFANSPDVGLYSGNISQKSRPARLVFKSNCKRELHYPWKCQFQTNSFLF